MAVVVVHYEGLGAQVHHVLGSFDGCFPVVVEHFLDESSVLEVEFGEGFEAEYFPCWFEESHDAGHYEDSVPDRLKGFFVDFFSYGVVGVDGPPGVVVFGGFEASAHVEAHLRSVQFF